MSKVMKILSLVVILAIVATFSFTTISLATGEDYRGTVTDLFEGGDSVDTGGITGVGANIVSIITTIGIIVAVVVLLILGIKYMMGSASEKAEYKKTMIPYLVGAILIFGASAIAKAVIAMSSSITGGA